MAKVYYTEHLTFDPKRAWVLLDAERKVIGLFTDKAKAEHAAISALVDAPNSGVTFTRCVVMPNFAVK